MIVHKHGDWQPNPPKKRGKPKVKLPANDAGQPEIVAEHAGTTIMGLDVVKPLELWPGDVTVQGEPWVWDGIKWETVKGSPYGLTEPAQPVDWTNLPEPIQVPWQHYYVDVSAWTQPGPVTPQVAYTVGGTWKWSNDKWQMVPAAPAAPTVNVLADIAVAIPALASAVDACPCGCCGRDLVHNLVVHLNDQQGWSREQIADWLETLDVDLSFTTPNMEEAA